jgi:cytochrome bd ubiquinol oxidase subunit II
MDYAFVWSCIFGIALFIYMALDGFDLGVGLLFPFTRSSEERDHLMNSIAPIWDANETWLVLVGGGLYGVFPKAYTFICNALYIPIISMLIFLVFRGVSFEFRFKASQKHRYIWSTTFFLGSLGASIFQGIILAQLISGFITVQGEFNGDYWAWLNPFNIVFANLIAVLYACMGCNFLVYKFKNETQKYFAKIGQHFVTAMSIYALILLCFSIVAIQSTEMFISQHHWIERFTLHPFIFYTIMIAMTACIYAWIKSLNTSSPEIMPFLWGTLFLAVSIFAFCFLGWPYIVPCV